MPENLFHSFTKCLKHKKQSVRLTKYLNGQTNVIYSLQLAIFHHLAQ